MVRSTQRERQIAVTAMKITGRTRLYAIIGDPIAQVRSPEIYTERFASMDVDAVLVPMHVPAQHFDAVVPGLLALGNLDGLIVTVPFKQRMVRFATRLGRTGQTVGAVNALRREADGSWTGDMFDGLGFVRGAERKGERLCGRHVTLFGAGGVGSAIACALAEAGAASIDLIDPETQKAEALQARLERAFSGCAFATVTGLRNGGIDMVVNASPVGMKDDDGLPGLIGSLDRETLVGDVVIRETPTPLIQLAMQSDCRWVDGRDLFAGQIEALSTFLTSGSGEVAAARNPSR
jgi:shikimate dehydrogenase